MYLFSLQDANASAFAMALPTIQKEMQLQQTDPQLQWIVSGYPLSCVSFPYWLFDRSLKYMFPGLFSPGLRQACRLIWEEEDLPDRFTHPCRRHSWMRLF
jgi:hypothetical protein